MATVFEVHTKAMEFAADNIDYVAHSKSIIMTIRGTYVVGDMYNADDNKEILHDQPVMFTDHALGQLAARLTIPVDYYRRCPPTLRIPQFNYWRKKYPGALLLRCRKKDISGKKFLAVRGLLTSKYVRLDNVYLSQTLTEVAPSVPVESYDLNDKNFHVRFRYDTPTIIQSNKGHKVSLSSGAHVANSEIGCRSCTVDAYLYINGTHGIILSKTRKKATPERLLYQQHRGLDENAFKQAVGEAVQASSTMSQEMGQQIVDMMNAGFRLKGQEVIEFLGKQRRYSDDFLKRVFKLYLEDKPNHKTKFGVINAFSRAAKELGIERRLQVEQFCGDLLNNRSMWSIL